MGLPGGVCPPVFHTCHPIATTEFPKVKSARELRRLKLSRLRLSHVHLKRKLPIAGHAQKADTGTQVCSRLCADSVVANGQLPTDSL